MEVFISHIHEEARLAQIFKEWIESTFLGQIKVFVSSDIKDIPAGSKWLAEMDAALISSSLFLMLCSPTSLIRPWVNFEAGCAWIKKVPLLPLCHSGAKKDKLPSPISVFQGIDLDSDKFVDDFFESIKTHFKITKLPRIDKKALVQELNETLKSISKIPLSKQIDQTKTPIAVSDEDALNIIESWMGNRDSYDNEKTIRYIDVDNELNLPEGTTKKLIEIAAKRFHYVVRRKGPDTILFEEEPDPSLRNPYDFPFY